MIFNKIFTIRLSHMVYPLNQILCNYANKLIFEWDYVQESPME